MKVSVCIPCYNAEKWIGAAIESALSQEGVTKEVIVIDDGSTDNSLGIIKTFENHITFKSGSNKGGNFARNQALSMAKGEWVQFLDGDDYLMPLKIKNQLDSVKNNDVDVIYSPVKVEDWHGNEKVYYETEVNTALDLYGQWIHWQVAQTGTLLWKKKSLEKIEGWNEGMPCCQDNELTMRAIMNGLMFHYFPKAEAVYRHWSEETVCRKDPTKVINVKTELLNRFRSWLKEEKFLVNSHDKAIGSACFEMARSLASKVSISTAYSYFIKQKRLGLIYPSGKSFPKSYSIIYKVLGFKAAESVAKLLR